MGVTVRAKQRAFFACSVNRTSCCNGSHVLERACRRCSVTRAAAWRRAVLSERDRRRFGKDIFEIPYNVHPCMRLQLS